MFIKNVQLDKDKYVSYVKDRGYSKIWNTTINLIQQEQGGLAMTRDNLDVGNVEFDNSKDKVCIHTGRNTTIN